MRPPARALSKVDFADSGTSHEHDDEQRPFHVQGVGLPAQVGGHAFQGGPRHGGERVAARPVEPRPQPGLQPAQGGGERAEQGGLRGRCQVGHDDPLRIRSFPRSPRYSGKGPGVRGRLSESIPPHPNPSHRSTGRRACRIDSNSSKNAPMRPAAAPPSGCGAGPVAAARTTSRRWPATSSATPPSAPKDAA